MAERIVAEAQGLSLGKRPALSSKEIAAIRCAIENAAWSIDMSWSVEVYCTVPYTEDDRQVVGIARLGHLTCSDPNEHLYLVVSHPKKERRGIFARNSKIVLRLTLETAIDDSHFEYSPRTVKLDDAEKALKAARARINRIEGLVKS